MSAADASAEAHLLHDSGLLCMGRGLHDEARSFFVKALDLLKALLTMDQQPALPTRGTQNPPGNLDPLPTCSTMGSSTSAQDLLTVSINLLLTHPSLLFSPDADSGQTTTLLVALLHNVALTYMGQENYADAKNWLELAQMEALLSTCSATNIAVSLCIYRSLGQCLHKLGDLNSALLNYCQLCYLQISAFGCNSLEVANTLSLMGRIQLLENRSDESLQLYQECLRIQEHSFGFDNICVSNTLNEIGIVLFGEGGTMHKCAITYFTKSLEIRQRLNGPLDKGNAIILFNLGTTYLETGDEDTTILLFRKALQVEQAQNNSSPQELIKMHELLGLIYQRRGELSEALTSLAQALQVARDNGLSLISGRILNLMGNIHLRQANVVETMKCFIEASRTFRNIPQPHDGVLSIRGFNYYSLSKRHPECAPMA